MKGIILLVFGIFLVISVSAISWSGGTINIINQTIGGLAGNPFDQILNTTSNVQFANITSIGNLTIKGNASFLDSLFVNNFVGIGIINPTFELEVIGSGKFTDDLLVGGDFFTTGIANINLNLLTVGEVAGRVGINTANPQQTLNVVGDGNFTGDLFIGGSQFIDWTNAIDNFKTSGTGQFNGNVGIGIAPSSTPLHLFSAENRVAKFESSDAVAYLLIEDSAGSQASIGTISNNLRLAVGDGIGTPSITIGSGGGTTLSGNLRVDGGNIGLTTDTDLIQLAINQIILNGNVGIGTTTPNEKLEVVGQLQLTNTTTEFSKIYTNANGDTIFT